MMTRPLACTLSLQGRHWIEASAGTGKTFTLSLLVLRLLLESEIALPNILAVTFTKAATEELKIKIRSQIKQAQDLLHIGLIGDIETLAPEKRASASVLKQLLPQKGEKHLRQLLDLAIQDCDRASVFTIHGFCQRILNDHALSAGQVLQSPELLENAAALNTRIAYDLWRELGADRDLMLSLARLWPRPELLAKQCDELLRVESLLPEAPATIPEAFDMQPYHQLLRKAFENHLADAQRLMQEAFDAGILNGTSYKLTQIETFFESLEDWYSLDSGLLPGKKMAFFKLAGDQVKTNKKFNDREPQSPLFDAITAWRDAADQAQKVQQAQDIRCLHIARQKLATRREALLQKMQQYGYDDMITRVLNALEGESGVALCQALRKEYPAALVDEFQDTDSQQWKIFSHLYPENLPELALYLIGDPKQAIYGFRGGDVHAYLAAKRESPEQWNLPDNFRTRASLLGAVQTLFETGGENAFRESDILFYPVQAGEAVQETDCVLDGGPVPAMQIAVLPEYISPQTQKPVAFPAGQARELASHACAEKIYELLTAGQRERLRIKDKNTKKIRAAEAMDVAVLVNTNAEAALMQHALSECGIASVIGSQENLFATEQAREVFIILDALIHYQSQSRWRGALSTVLLGYHADQIVVLEYDDAAANQSADLLMHYREKWLKQGVLSLLSQLCADAAARILALVDGERRLSNYLQLAEALQQASAMALGPEQCLHWLGSAMQNESIDEENMLRLDSDQRRVKIMTLHKSKGLEFPFVFLPFASFGKANKGSGGLRLINYHEQHRRLTYALTGNDDEGIVDAIKAIAAEEQLAEQVRLLYVGLTRAQYFCWLCCGQVRQSNTSGLASLIFRNEKDQVKTPDHAGILQKLDVIHHGNSDITVIQLSGQKRELPPFTGNTNSAPVSIALPATHIDQDWRVLSFSQLTHGSSHSGPAVTAAADEVQVGTVELSADMEAFDRRFSGIAFGNALHHVLENTEVNAWANHDQASYAPESELPLLHLALLRQGYLQEELEAGATQLAPLVFNTLRTRMPEGLRLCDLPEHQRLNEMEFHFSLRECDSQALLALLKKHGVLQQREDFPFLRRLNGLMTGKVDLIYRHDGRFYVCDYKSNRLPAYDAGQCLQAMRDSEYDFQALIYTLALHRWCRFRLQSNYDYEKQMGGVRYLFCRGMDANSNDGEGIVALRFERALLEQLEALLLPLQEQAA
ncbi:MAG: exodeoxyribonuclease V subunit beta [Arenimonas sp.]